MLQEVWGPQHLEIAMAFLSISINNIEKTYAWASQIIRTRCYT